MVIHDHEREQQWAAEQQTRSKQKNKREKRPPRRLSLLAVQSLACAIILVVVLLFRVAGGTAYTQLRQGFADALAGNELMTVLMRWWDGDPTESAPLAEEEDVKDGSFTSSSALLRRGWTPYA